MFKNNKKEFIEIYGLFFNDTEVMAKSKTSSVTGSKHTTKTVTKAGKADKRTSLGGSKKKK